MDETLEFSEEESQKLNQYWNKCTEDWYEEYKTYEETKNIEIKWIKKFYKARKTNIKNKCIFSFLIKCRNHNIQPPQLKINKFNKKQYQKIIEKTEKELLNHEIGRIKRKADNIEEKAYYMHLRLLSTTQLQLNGTFGNSYFTFIQRDEEFYSNKYEKRFLWLQRKIQNKQRINKPENEILNQNKKPDEADNKTYVYQRSNRANQQQKMENQLQVKDNQNMPDIINTINDQNIQCNNKAFINLSTYNLTPPEKEILKLGANFVLKTNPQLTEIVTKCENIISAAPMENQDELRNKAANIINKFPKKQNPNIETLKKLKNNKNIRILEADKTKTLVIINEDDYQKKISEMLTDLKVKELKEDPLHNYIKKINNLAKTKYLPKTIAEECKPPQQPNIPNMFTKIKVHKENTPLRPVIAKYCAPTYRLEKALANFLTCIIDKKYNISSSEEACQRIKNIEKDITKNSIMASFDVKNLFPSLNLNQTKQIILNKLRELNTLTEKEIKTIEKALELTFEANFFKMNGKTYRQTQGAPMGSPLSPLLAEVTLQYFENKLFNVTKPPLLYIRYVDDILCISNEGPEEIKSIAMKLNNLCTYLKFTTENEENETINFLDLQILKKERKIIFSIYRKPTYTPMPANIKSEQPFQHKLANFRAFMQRAFILPISNKARQKEINFIKNLMLNNGYKYKDFHKLLKKFKKKFFPKTRLQPIENKNINKNQKYIAAPYMKELIPFYRQFEKTTKNQYKIAFKTQPNLKKYCSNDRDKYTPKSGVYMIPISIQNPNNESIPQVYIGQTQRLLHFRIEEHKKDVKEKNQKTALSRTVRQEENTIVHWDQAKIISTIQDSRNLLLQESIQIFLHKNLCVNEQPSVKINEQWTSILKKNKKYLCKNSPIYDWYYNNLFET